MKPGCAPSSGPSSRARASSRPEAAEEPDRGNVVDLMAALRKSLGQSSAEAPAAKKETTKAKAASKTAAVPKAKSGKKAAETPSAPVRATRKRA